MISRIGRSIHFLLEGEVALPILHLRRCESGMDRKIVEGWGWG